MITGAIFTLTQALQLVGLVPSLFLVIFLGSLSPRNRHAIIPSLYFLSLACAFALPLLEIHPVFLENPWVPGLLLFGESVLVAFSFLMIMQFMIGRIPPLPYWLVLAIPLLGGGSIIYASILQGGDCTFDQSCLDVHSVKTLYNIFGSALVFLLLVYYASRSSGPAGDDASKKHKYWLIIALILSHLIVLAIDLGQLAGRINAMEAEFASVVLRINFIYLVITSLFRVLYPSLVNQAMQMVSTTRKYDPEADKPHVDKLKTLLDVEHVYREMRLNRAALAAKVGISENHLSRVINGHWGKNFNELINSYRIEEAKQRLKSEPSQITTIAFEVGFNSIASFNRVFKEKVGLSPTDFRSGASV